MLVRQLGAWQPTGPMHSMQVDVCASESRADIQELNLLAEHADVAQLSVVARVTVLKHVSALEREAAVFVSGRFDIGERNRVVEELHVLRQTLAAGSPHGDFMDTGAVEPQPEKSAQNACAEDFKP
jgi:hypothetical protein